MKTKNKRLKQLTRDSLPVGILGIGESMMSAVTLPLGKSFVTFECKTIFYIHTEKKFRI